MFDFCFIGDEAFSEDDIPEDVSSAHKKARGMNEKYVIKLPGMTFSMIYSYFL